MKQSEYKTQAYINNRLNQQDALNSLEGSAALIQPDKPEVDATDVQKAQILAKTDNKPVVRENPMKTASRTINPTKRKHKN